MIFIVTDQTISRPIPAEVMNMSIDIWTISLILAATLYLLITESKQYSW
jgi:hypothetical protein